jgi:predicted DNA-binding transcriptional regulator YafY
VLFLGRKVYLGAVVVLVSVLRQGPSPTRLARLKKLVGVSPRTVRRWRKWWLENFVQSDFWKAARGRLRVPLEESQLPRSLLESFEADSVLLRLVDLLRFVSPLTVSSPVTGLGF